MLTVHYVKVEREFIAALPESVQFLKIMERQGKPHLYYLYDTKEPRTLYNFKAFGTGHDIPNSDPAWWYIDSFTVKEDMFPTMFFHLFYQLGLRYEAAPS